MELNAGWLMARLRLLRLPCSFSVSHSAFLSSSVARFFSRVGEFAGIIEARNGQQVSMQRTVDRVRSSGSTSATNRTHAQWIQTTQRWRDGLESILQHVQWTMTQRAEKASTSFAAASSPLAPHRGKTLRRKSLRSKRSIVSVDGVLFSSDTKPSS